MTQVAKLQQLSQQDDFSRRHLGSNPQQVKQMLESLGLQDLDQLVKETVPSTILMDKPLDEDLVGTATTEQDMLDYLQNMMEENVINKSMIGLGYYDCHTPSVLLRNFVENPGWYTAYTPYQSEIAQGRLELLLNYQQMVVDLTGMDCANASLLDEATAAAEAMTLAKRSAKNKGNKFFASNKCFPQTHALLETRSKPLGIELIIGDIQDYLDAPEEFFGVLIQNPDLHGEIYDFSNISKIAHENNTLVCVATDLLALVLLKSPAEMGADIVLGNSQRFGVPLGFGGPHAAFFAVRDALKRSIPGRLIGVSIDAKGKQALRMALQTREQHIRRDKATSNICTAQVLLANLAGLYASYHGYEGLLQIAQRVHRMAAIASAILQKNSYELTSQNNFFDTLSVKTSNAKDLAAKAEKAGYNLCLLDNDHLQMSFDETTQAKDLLALLKILGCSINEADIEKIDSELGQYVFAKNLIREDKILTHPVFNSHQTETKMMRYLRKLQQKDIGLDRSMISLGSCTMKLNAASEMIPVTWQSVNSIHPFAPSNQTKGYAKLIDELTTMLKEITGFAAVSFQPNSGAQGEYAGLLAIRSYHLSRGDTERNICLIPSSAHGTNPASAVMAGMKVEVIQCDEKGNIDISFLRDKIEANKGKIAALMVTYPSTHGVFESAIKEICQMIHDDGGQVYMDGANLNALVGIAKPGEIGADVCHMNLHKTFCIPHGGGGPGMGPIGVAPQLAKFLPKHCVERGLGKENADKSDLNSVSAAPFGSASILVISWAYIKMMGASGITNATKHAILNANYIANRLKDHFPILYTGDAGRSAHECIFDMRDFKKDCGISEEDIAKRLIDYGFHAPTMSFPVAGTLMVEPTESESKEELDLFCDAMIKIRGEIAEVADGEMTLEDNPLVNAPHSLADLADEWNHAYSKDKAFFGLPSLFEDKYIPPVNRVNNPHGDRNLFCVCPPMEDWDKSNQDPEAEADAA